MAKQNIYNGEYYTKDMLSVSTQIWTTNLYGGLSHGTYDGCQGNEWT